MAAPVPDLSGSYKWEKLPEIPTGRVYAVGGYHDGKLYVLGKKYPKHANIGNISLYRPFYHN